MRSARLAGSRAGPGGVVRAAVGAPVLVGRERELERLGGLVGAVSEGRGRTVLVSGEAGIGKSRLVAEVLASCEARRFRVFSAAADEVERRRPFGVVTDALGVRERRDEGRAEVCWLLDGVDAGAGGLGLESRIAELLVGVVKRECEAGPAVVVVVDDLQWADESSLVAVKGIARLARSRPVLLVCVLRPYPASVPLRALLASLDYLQAVRVELGGLEPGEVSELAAGLLGAPPGGTLERALAEAGGNPFYVSELLRCLVREGDAGISSGGVLELAGVGLPPSLRLAVLDELRFLPDATLALLRAAVVVGRAFSVSELALISPSSVPDVIAGLESAQEAGVLVAEGERLAFRHDLIREAIYEDLAPAARRARHRFLASRLAESGAGWGRVAAQVMLGADPGDAEAIGWLRTAARQVGASSPAIAAELLSRALELAEDPGRARMGLLVDLVRPLLWTGQAARAERVCTEALEAGPKDGEAPLFWMGLVISLILQGHFAWARETTDRAAVCDGMTESDLWHVRSSRALCGLFLGEGVDQAREIVASAPRSIPKGIAQEVIAQWELFTGRADRALAAYELVDGMREPPELESRVWQGSGIRVRMWEGLALLDLDRLDDAAEVLEREIAAKLAVPALPHAFLAACRYHAGRFDDALRECDAASAAAETAGAFTPASAPALAATIALRQGRVQDAQRLLEQAEDAAQPAEAAGDTIVRWTRTLLLEAAGEVEQAADAAADAVEAYQRAGFASYLAWHAPDFVRVALVAGRPEQARAAAEAAERAAEQLPVSSRRVGALRARGLLGGSPGILTDALAAARDAPRPIDLALTLLDAAAALASHGERTHSRRHADEALELLSRLGAAGDERRARQLLRTAGLKISARAKHTSGRAGWDSLTEAEQQIVALTTKGRSNPEIASALYLSRRTVRWHLANIFRKVGVSSRTELTAEALRRGLD